MGENIAGIYRHFRGAIYRVIGLATHSESFSELVVYVDKNGKMWARPKDSFFERVEVEPGVFVSRFEKVEGYNG